MYIYSAVSARAAAPAALSPPAASAASASAARASAAFLPRSPSASMYTTTWRAARRGEPLMKVADSAKVAEAEGGIGG